MTNRLWGPVLALSLLLSGCAQPAQGENAQLHILATTYPVYLFTTALTEGVEGVEVSLLVNAQTSCLHDYTLTVKDMKAIEGADVIAMNGAGLEEFMSDALSTSDAAVIDCSEGIELLPTLEHAGHDGHDHEEEGDPHIWMSADAALVMLNNLLHGLDRLDPAHLEDYEANFQAAAALLPADSDLSQQVGCREVITFHDGFQYLVRAAGLHLLKAIEEEEGSTASAAEIKEIVALIGEYRIPAIFVEKNGSRATADVIARETGCAVYELDMLMSGTGSGLQPYLDAMNANLNTISEALQ